MLVNPNDCPNTEVFKRFSKELKEIDNLNVINLSNLLESKYFYDHTHANKNGAEIISYEMGKILEILDLKLP